jgi:hypothetical protein
MGKLLKIGTYSHYSIYLIMKSLINQLKDHLQATEYINQKSAFEIVSFYKDDPRIQSSLYSGEAYRALLFTEMPDHKLTVVHDSCFSLSLDGIAHYIKNQDLSYYNFVIVFKVELKNSLNISSLVEDLCEEDLSDIHYDLSLEEELVASVVENEILFYFGDVDGFFLKYP